MNASLELFLNKSDTAKNLDQLTKFEYSANNKTKCMTEEVYKKVPKTSISPGTLREICLVTSLATISSAPFLFTAKKLMDCGLLLYKGDFNTAQQQWEGLSDVFNKPSLPMTFLCFASMLALGGVGMYAGARYFFQDHKQEERFLLLDTQYSKIAHYLETQIDDKKEAATLAQKLLQNQSLIRSALIREAKLSEPQADILIGKIAIAASRTLERAAEPSISTSTSVPPLRKQTISPNRLPLNPSVGA